MELAPGDLLAGRRDHRVALDGAGAALACEVDGGACERAADAAAPEAHATDEARHRPHAVVGLVFGSAGPNERFALQPPVCVARPARAPATRLAVEVGDQAGGGLRLGLPATGLLAQPL